MKEYRYRTNLLLKVSCAALALMATGIYIFSAIAFIRAVDLSNLFMYTLFMLFFLYMFRYLYLVYIVSQPVLIIDEEHFLFFSPIGLKDIKYEDILKIELKKTMRLVYLLINSSTAAPISLRLKRFDAPADEIVEELNKKFKQFKKTT